MSGSPDFLATVLDARPIPDIGDLDAWWATFAATKAFEDTIARAIVAGAVADRVGYAFASGYQCALAASLGADGPSSVLVTEEGGGHPRAIETTLSAFGDGWKLRGAKRFATLGTFAETLYVLAREGERDGLPTLRIVRIARATEGVTVEPMPATPFCPEIPHATVSLSNVIVDAGDVLPGDGYAKYVRPFRTIEDLHVFGALVGHAIGVAVRTRMAATFVERLLALAVLVHALGARAHDAPATALALEGALVHVREALGQMPDLLRPIDPEACARWERDTGILRVAASVRAARATKARSAFGL